MKQAIDYLNCLFMILLDIHDPEKPNFFQRFKQGHIKLKESYTRISEKKLRHGQLPSEFIIVKIEKDMKEVGDKNEDIMIKNEKF